MFFSTRCATEAECHQHGWTVPKTGAWPKLDTSSHLIWRWPCAPQHDASARQCSPELVQGLAQAASSVTGTEVGALSREALLSPLRSCGCRRHDPPRISARAGSVPKITSGAGHDALAIADVAPIGMLFVRCKDGLSHTPLEFTSPEDVAASASALLQFLRLYTGVAAKLDTNDEL